MIKEMRDFVLELVQSEYETGHILAEDRAEFNELCREEGYRATKAMYDLYEECHNLGPAGFYAEYKDELDFDPMFVSEYGDEDDEESISILENAGFSLLRNESDFIYVELNAPLNSKDIGLFQYNNQLLIRKFIVRKNDLVLRAESNEIDDIFSTYAVK